MLSIILMSICAMLVTAGLGAFTMLAWMLDSMSWMITFSFLLIVAITFYSVVLIKEVYEYEYRDE